MHKLPSHESQTKIDLPILSYDLSTCIRVIDPEFNPVHKSVLSHSFQPVLVDHVTVYLQLGQLRTLISMVSIMYNMLVCSYYISVDIVSFTEAYTTQCTMRTSFVLLIRQHTLGAFFSLSGFFQLTSKSSLEMMKNVKSRHCSYK